MKINQESDYIFKGNLISNLQKIQEYLSSQIAQEESYSVLIQDLNLLVEEITNYRLKIKVIGHKSSFIEQLETIHHQSDRLNNFCQFISFTFPHNLDRVVEDSDLVCLVVNPLKIITPIEIKLIDKAKLANVTLLYLGFNQTTLHNSIQTWLGKEVVQNINCFEFSQALISEFESSATATKYYTFLEQFLFTILPQVESKLQDKSYKHLQKFFSQTKLTRWTIIEEQKKHFLSNQIPEEVKIKINQLPHKINKICQNTFRIIKQEFNGGKTELINPFVSTGFMYRVQNIVQEATVIKYKENQQFYLDLVIENNGYQKLIHTYILELYQQEIDTWIEKKWDYLEQELGVFSQFFQESDCQLEFLQNLYDTKINLNYLSKPTFQLHDYICLSTLAESNKTTFDYHYTQSTWFRITIAIFVGSMIFLLTDRLFGFILLFMQIINLITGQSAKSLKFKQQSKELKRTVDNKYQFLIRFVADRLLQDLTVFFDQQCQSYQEEIDNIIQEADQKLTEVKQTITLNRDSINNLNQDQETILKQYF